MSFAPPPPSHPPTHTHDATVVIKLEMGDAGLVRYFSLFVYDVHFALSDRMSDGTVGIRLEMRDE